jgi:hypothetical protein
MPDSQARWFRRRDVMAHLGVFGIAAGCASQGAKAKDILGPIDPHLYVPWNAPEAEAAARRRAPPERLPDARFNDHAVSPDGTLVAATLPFAPLNEIVVFEIANRRGWRLRHPNPRVQLARPVFAPDGRLALVVTPPSYFGISEIWITSPRGGACQVIAGNPSRLYYKPSFSHDGRRVVVFRDVWPGILPPPARQIRREHREVPPLSLFEIDLASGAESQLSERGFERGEAFYAPDGGFFLSTSFPLIAGRRMPEGWIWWERSQDITPLNNQTNPFAGFFLARGAEIPDVPVSIIPDDLMRADPRRGPGAFLAGADGAGRLLIVFLHNDSSAPYGHTRSVALVEDSRELHRLSLNGARLGKARLSVDGATVVANVQDSFQNGQVVSYFDRIQPYAFAISRNGAAATMLSTADISIDATGILLEGASNSEMQS